MAKKNYAELNVKAAAITGAIVGLVWSLLAVLAVGSMGMMGYGMMGGYGSGLLAVVFSAAVWAIVFGFMAAVYNYALKNWSK